MSREEFGAHTIRELFRAFVAEKRRRDDDLNLRSFHAWQTVNVFAHLKAKKRMPKLKTFMNVTKRQGHQTPREMRAAIRQIAASLPRAPRKG